SFNGFLEAWNPNIEHLVKAGYRVVAYDLWGRGLSSSPRVDLSLTVFRDQLNAIITRSGANKVHLVGSSFGCVIAADYALHDPGSVEKLVLIGPAGFPSEGDKTSTLLNAPILGDVLFHYFGERILKAKVDEYFFNEKADWAIEKWEKYAKYPGFTRSALSTLRHSPVLDYTEGWRRQGALGKPTLFIWGKQDVSFPFSNTEKVAALMPHAEIVAIEAAAHWLNIEKPFQVNEAMVSFLAR
ncbi:MAG: alpha/beta hydrolase, partial [Rubrivivax sp.]|nr:alpha/beta hydrolase [Pyrinomonadaceae bacterium]